MSAPKKKGTNWNAVNEVVQIGRDYIQTYQLIRGFFAD